MPGTPNLFHSWLRPSRLIPASSILGKFLVACRQYRPQVAAATVIAISGSACAVGAVQLSTHWGDLTQHERTTHTIGNIVEHTDAGATAASQPNRQAAVSVRSDSTTSTGASSSTTVTTNTTASNPSDRTSVTINGQSIPVPASGSVSKDIVDANGSTSVNVSNDTAGSNASVNVQVNSSSGSGGLQ